MKIAVIGSNGYVGRYLCKAHADRGDQVIGLSSSTGGIDPATGVFPSNLSFPKGIDTVYFMAQSPLYRDVPAHADHLLSVNCIAAVQAAEAARRIGVKQFFYASTGNVYKPSFDPITESSSIHRDNWYPLSKVMAEDALRLFRSDMQVIVARIFGVYGPDQTGKLVPSLIDSVREGKEIFLDRNQNDSGDINGLRISFMYIDDLIKAFVGLADHPSPPELINLAGERAYSLREISQMVGRMLHIDPSITITDKTRLGNLIADVGLLKSVTNMTFTKIEKGLAKMLGLNEVLECSN